jgi:hypothetical protein
VTELVIGARRPGQHRRLRSAGIALLLAFVVGTVSYLIYGRVVSYSEPSGSVPSGPVAMRPALEPGAPPVLAWGECSLAHVGDLAVLRLVGKPHTLGACHGRLLGAVLVARVTRSLAQTIDETVPDGGLFGGMLHGARLRWRFRMLDEGIPPDVLAEIGGQLHGAERSGSAPSFESMVRSQAAIDVGGAAAGAPGADYHAVGRGLSFVVTAGAGKAAAGAPPVSAALLVGRTFSLLGAEDGGESAGAARVVSFVRQEGAIAYASVGWPGLVGAVTGQNAEGIAVLVHPASSSDVRATRAAPPAAIVARAVLERAHSLDEAIKVVEKMAPLGAAGFLIVDGPRGLVAWIERSPGRTRVTRAPSPAVAGDYFTTEPFLDDPDNDRSRRTRPSTARTARAAELARHAAAASPDAVLAILRDSAAVGGAALPPGHRAAIDDPEAVHTVVMDPAQGILWVAEGPGAGGRFRAFDVKRELAAETARPLPVDLPADPARDPSVAAQVVAARRELREARRREGSRAREMAARALVRRPDLPEALLLAGQLAHEAGERDQARALLSRYLELGADDAAAEEQVRALLRED